MIPWLIGSFLLFLCWGSFLNVVAYRIIRGYSFKGRSFCPHCRHPLAWYDLIPVVSWIALWGRCRNCRNVISPLYPFIELLTGLLFTLMFFFIDSYYWLGYSIFISASIVTIRTDFEKMLISRYMTLALIPIAFILSIFHMLPITFYQSIQGALFGYLVLWTLARLFYHLRNNEGLGEGDIDLLAMIGSFTGIAGAWTALFLGSLLGIIASIVQMLISKRVRLKIAFGPWLVAGALIYIFFQDKIFTLFTVLS